MRTDGPVVVALDGTPNSAHTLEWGVAEAVRPRGERAAGPRRRRRVARHGLELVPDRRPRRRSRPTSMQYLRDLQPHRPGAAPRPPRRDPGAHGQVVPALRELSEDAQLLVVGPGPAAAGADRIDRRPRHRARALPRRRRAHRSRRTRRRPDGAGRGRRRRVGRRPSPRRTSPRRRPGCAAAGSSSCTRARRSRTRPAPAAWRRSAWTTWTTSRTRRRASRSTRSGRRTGPDGRPRPRGRRPGGRPHEVRGGRGAGGRRLARPRWFRGMLLGSVSGAVVREATCPVLVVHDGT